MATQVVSGPHDDIEGEVYNNTARATKRLALGEGARLQRTMGSFLTLDALVKSYPDRTKFGRVRQMRQQLLPHIRGYLKREPPRSPIATEDFILGDADSPHRATIKSQWPAIEPLLRREYSRSEGGDATVLLRVLTRGSCLVGQDRRVNCTVPLNVSVPLLVQRLGERAPRLRGLLEALHANLRADEFKRARLKARLQRVAELKLHGAPRLKDKFLHYLYEHDRAFLRALEGHRERMERLQAWQVGSSPEYSPLLHKLIDNSVFKPFEVYAPRTG
ncbi:hypothetical protein WME76_39960 [Sorangium sp. So ce119]|uniref:hypothetical protein n=1 Tax=Sorangium sp. So ce119 TaxID=3133279 RepID=UPI003F5E08C1